MVYTPQNPAFGGSELNYSWLLNSATSQNSFTDPNAFGSFNDDPLANFTEGLERQLLNQLTREIFDRQTGEGILAEEGSTQIGNYQVDVNPGIEGLFINITDITTGGTTQLSIPFF